jgi:glycosyltransferase involved in cell wall biosynthesis
MSEMLAPHLSVLGTAVVTLALLHSVAVLVVTVRPHLALRNVLLTVGGAGAALVLLGPAAPAERVVVVAAVVASSAYLVWRRHQLLPAGALLWATFGLLAVTTLAWGAAFLASLDLSLASTVLMVSVATLGAVSLPSVLVQTREGWEPLLRRTWTRPRSPLPTRTRAVWPKVSVHVPCHAEPPEVVIATLESVAALDYPDFEVLVIDNNTADEGLWRPVEEACRRLGDRFRFLHVMGIEGAKAGALNWALPQADPSATVIAVVDADYQVRPDWLRATVGYFDDPRIGFVQSPHAYRDFAHATFGRWANWEYAVFFATGMVSLNEHNAGLTVGTMSLVRRRALEEAGGWAEWCLTEDSELAIRVHAAGYDSVYVNEAYGRGLIPETFAGYRKQRFRWTYGPVQELKRHWRLFLPARRGGCPSLDLAQKVHHANHGLDVVFIGVRALGLPLAAAAGVSMVVHDERVVLPLELWAAATAVTVGQLALRWVVYRRVLRATFREAVGGMVAFAALSHVIVVASLSALLARPARWHRTDKFRTRSRGLAALAETRAEVLLGGALAVTAAGLALAAPGGLVTMLAVGLAIQAVAYVAAPLVALVADRDVRRSGDTLADEVTAYQQEPLTAHAAA